MCFQEVRDTYLRAITKEQCSSAYGERVHDLSRADFENLLAFRTSLRRFLHWSQTQAHTVGLTPAQHQLLVAIKGHPADQDPTISDLAGYLLLRHHSAVELVDRAEAAGLVERRGDVEDGRLTRVRLTADGEDRLSRLAPTHLDELRNLAPVLHQLVDGWVREQAGTAVSAGSGGRGAGSDHDRQVLPLPLAAGPEPVERAGPRLAAVNPGTPDPDLGDTRSGPRG